MKLILTEPVNQFAIYGHIDIYYWLVDIAKKYSDVKNDKDFVPTDIDIILNGVRHQFAFRGKAVDTDLLKTLRGMPLRKRMLCNMQSIEINESEQKLKITI